MFLTIFCLKVVLNCEKQFFDFELTSLMAKVIKKIVCIKELKVGSKFFEKPESNLMSKQS